MTSFRTPRHHDPVARRRSHAIRPWWKWLLTALAFPPAGYIGHKIGGPVDSVSAAMVGGLITGAGIGVAQWMLLRRSGITAAWIAATSAASVATRPIGTT